MSTTMKSIGRVLTHMRRNVIAYAAMFLVVAGGTAAALPGKNTVDSGDIRKRAVQSKDIAKQAVKQKTIADGAVTTQKLADGAVTGAKADEASFTGLIQGDGEVFTRAATADRVGFLPEPITLAEVPGMGVVELLYCGGAPDYQIRVRALSADDSQPFLYVGQVTSSELPAGVGPGAVSDQGAGTLGGGGGEPLIARGGGIGTAGKWDYHFSRGTGDDTTGAHVSVSGANSLLTDNKCQVTATAELQD
jgi:hypothetical protein